MNTLNKSIVVCFALKEEAAPFHKIAAGRPGIFTLIVGIGRQNAGKSFGNFFETLKTLNIAIRSYRTTSTRS